MVDLDSLVYLHYCFASLAVVCFFSNSMRIAGESPSSNCPDFSDHKKAMRNPTANIREMKIKTKMISINVEFYLNDGAKLLISSMKLPDDAQDKN
jgi:hypothetical protein